MTQVLERPSTGVRPATGGLPARRAVTRWAWRLLRREWRQQLLVLILVTVAVAAVVVGAGVAVNTPIPSQVGFGTANAMIQLGGSSPNVASTVASLERRVGTVDVIDNETLPVPGSLATFQLRAQDSHGLYDASMVALVSGRLPVAASEVAVTAGVARDFGLRVGSTWLVAGAARHVVGMVQDPLNLLDDFALVPPGGVTAPSQVVLLFHAANPRAVAADVQTPPNTLNGGFNPEIFVILISTVGMLLIALVAVGGFTVLAQRRMRAIGMLGAIGATERNVGLVVRANGLAVGLVGTAMGFALGMLAWLAYRPRVEGASHHLIGVFQLPWVVVLPAMALAVLATWLAAARPARAAARVPIVTALSGRPPAPRQLHRSAVPGVVFGAIGYVALLYAGQSKGNGGGALALVFGFVALIVAIILLSPLALTSAAKLGRRAPIAVRMALRDLARHRARSGSALGAIGLTVLIAATICVAGAARYGNPLDYAGPNLAANQLVVYAPQPPPPPGAQITQGPDGRQVIKQASGNSQPAPDPAKLLPTVDAIAASLGSHQVVELDQPDGNLDHHGRGRQFNGQLYVATPQMLRAFGISQSQVDPRADILTMRPGLASVTGLHFDYGGFTGPVPGGPEGSVAAPRMQTIGALPSGTSAPNTVVTEHAVHRLGLTTSVAGWLIITSHPITTTQVLDARHSAAAGGMTIESKSDAPSGTQVIDWATVAGMLLALAILAMTVGLIRAETSSDLRTLTATGASASTRRTLTAVTAGALGFVGALLGTAAAYLACIAFFSGSPNGDGLGELGNVPLSQLSLIVVAMPVLATAAGWLLAGREQSAIAHQPLE